jgi:hypothetical protein
VLIFLTNVLLLVIICELATCVLDGCYKFYLDDEYSTIKSLAL